MLRLTVKQNQRQEEKQRKKQRKPKKIPLKCSPKKLAAPEKNIK